MSVSFAGDHESMSTGQWVILVLVLLVIAALALIPPLIAPMAILLGIAIAVFLYRIGNSLQMGFNEHTKAMQAIYDEIARQSQTVKPPGASPEQPAQSN